MPRTHRLIIFMLLVITATALASCGGAPAPQSSGATTAPVASSAAPAATLAPAPTAVTAPTAATPLPRATAQTAAVNAPLFDYDPQASLDIQAIGADRPGAGFTIHNFSFASPKGGRVPAYLVVPDGPGPFAGVLLMPGSSELRGGPLLWYAQDLAKTGVVSLLLDGPAARFPHGGSSLFRWTEEDRAIVVHYIIDLRRGIDLLTARPEVDPKRLGYIGIGFNGAMGGVLAGVDKRIKAYVLNAAPINYVTQIMEPSHNLHSALQQVPQAQQQRWAAAYEPVQPEHYIGHAAPAALFFQPVLHDNFTTKADTERLYQAASEPKQITWYDATRDTSLNGETIRDQLAWFKTELGIAAEKFDGKALSSGGILTNPTAAATAASATSAPLADTNPAKPDDATQARLRVSNCVTNGPNAEVLVNGKVAVNGGMPQVNLGSLEASGYLYLAPGTYSVALVPTGKGIDEALLGPLDVPVVAGHRYTVVALGQADEASHTPLVIDETEAYQKAGLSPESWGQITINNIKRASGISFLMDGAGTRDVPYGGFAAAAFPAGPINDFKVIFSGSPEPVVDNPGAGLSVPAVDFLDCFSGVFPDELGNFSSAATSTLNTIGFLQAQTDVSAKNGGRTSAYTTLLAAIKTAGLTDLLTTGGPYLLLAPTDETFAALPKDQLDALLADPNALRDLLHGHIVEGYYPYGTIAAAPGLRGTERTVTNMRGEQLRLTRKHGAFTINGENVTPVAPDMPMNHGPADSLMLANGNSMFPVAKLLLPDAK
jgi:hypothetical protein